MLGRLVRVSVALWLSILPLSTFAQLARTWEFDLRTPGTYKVQIEHKIAESPGTKVSYTISIGNDTKTREFDLVANRPFFPLVADVPTPKKMRVAINGLSDAALKETRVYAYNADHVPYWEYFDPAKDNGLQEIEQVRRLLALPEEKLDLARFKLAIDKLVSPDADIAKALKELDGMVRKIKAMPEYGPSPTNRAIALQRFIYDAGPWNGHGPFLYDFDDPLGETPSNKLLTTYLASRRGNCVTMPLLFIILGQKLGIHVTATTAPNHILVKFRNELGIWLDLEATSGANPIRTDWLQQQMPRMTDRAIENGAYLQVLTKKETAVLMAGLLTEHYFKQEQYQRVIAAADLLLQYYPKDVLMMARKAAAYGRLSQRYFAERMRLSAKIPPAPTWYYEHLMRNNHLWFRKAEALGWSEETKQERQEYLRRIKDATDERAASPQGAPR